MNRFLCRLGVIAVLWGGAYHALAYDNELWMSFTKKLWDNASDKQPATTKISWYTELRQRDDGRDNYGAFNGLILRHDINPYLQVGAGVKHIALRNRDRSYDPRFRTELEITPKLPFGENNQFNISLRNRWEMFKDEGKKDLNRMRHRLQINGKIQGQGWLKGWYISHELIYNLRAGHYDLRQYRMIPIGLKFNINNTPVSAFYMLARGPGNPHGDNYDHVLGFSFAL